MKASNLTDAQRIAILENALAAARDELRMLSEWRLRAWAHDRDMGFSERRFVDGEDWDCMESVARSAEVSAAAALKTA